MKPKKVVFGSMPLRGHILLTPKTCDCGGRTGNCPVCDWGLGVCSVCGAGEIELEEECNPKRKERK